MDPISISIELGVIFLAGVGAVHTWNVNRHKRKEREQAAKHHAELLEQQERHHRERLEHE